MKSKLVEMVALGLNEARARHVQIRHHPAQKLIVAEILAPVDDEADGQERDQEHREEHQPEQLVSQARGDLALQRRPHDPDPAIVSCPVRGSAGTAEAGLPISSRPSS